MFSNHLNIQFCVSTKSPKTFTMSKVYFLLTKEDFAREISLCLLGSRRDARFRSRFRIDGFW